MLAVAAQENFIDSTGMAETWVELSGTRPAEQGHHGANLSHPDERAKPWPEHQQSVVRALRLLPEEVFRHAGLLPPARPLFEGEEELIYHFEILGEDDRKHLLAMARTLHKMVEQQASE